MKLPNFQPTESVVELIELIASPAKFRERLELLRGVEEKLAKALKDLGGAQDLEDRLVLASVAKKAALEDRNAASQEREDARKAGLQTIKDAKDRVDQEHEALATREADLDASIAQLLTEQKAFAVVVKETAVAQHNAELVTAEAVRETAEARALQAEYREKLEKFRALAG